MASFIRSRSRNFDSSSESDDSSISSSSSNSSQSNSNLSIPFSFRRKKKLSSKIAKVVENLDLSLSQYTTDDLERNFSTTTILKENVLTINLSANALNTLPPSIHQFSNLTSLDLSQNSLVKLDSCITNLKNLTTLIASNNYLNENSFPKNFSQALGNSLKVLSLGGNQFTYIPDQIFELINLRSLFFGSNRLQIIPKKIKSLKKLQNLYLGGNYLEEIPYEVGLLQNLRSLSLCENRLHELPPSIAYLRNLKSLALHRNELTALPPEIVKLSSLYELSLRDNPLVVRFVKDMVYNPPSLLELAGRSLKVNKFSYNEADLPKHLIKYLTTAQRCVNPKCKGVYFDTRVEHIKFVDFCGIYRLPLLQYLCSSSCTTNNPSLLMTSSEDENYVPERLQRVLLGSN